MVGAITGIQLHRYNDLIKLLVQEELENWQHARPGRKTHFIDINLTDAENQEFINAIPTDFTLEPKQVDVLIEHGYQTATKPSQKKKDCVYHAIHTTSKITSYYL